MQRPQWKMICSAVYRGVALCAALGGVVLSFARAPFWQDVISFYGVQSSLVAALMFALLFIFDLFGGMRRNELFYLLKNAVTALLFLTAGVYYLVIVPSNPVANPVTPQGVLLHAAVPALALGDYLLFDEKGKLCFYAPFVWLILPSVYLGYIFLRPLFGAPLFQNPFQEGFSAVPYRFLAADYMGGPWGVIGNIAVIAAGYLAVCFLLMLLDRCLGAAARKKDQ